MCFIPSVRVSWNRFLLANASRRYAIGRGIGVLDMEQDTVGTIVDLIGGKGLRGFEASAQARYMVQAFASGEGCPFLDI